MGVRLEQSGVSLPQPGENDSQTPPPRILHHIDEFIFTAVCEVSATRIAPGVFFIRTSTSRYTVYKPVIWIAAGTSAKADDVGNESKPLDQSESRLHLLSVNTWPPELCVRPCAPWCRLALLPSACARNPDIFNRREKNGIHI